mgnify:CR=1 FL=1
MSLSINEIKNFKKKERIKIYNYIGSLFSQDYYPYLRPSELELKYKIWGENNFLMQDKESKEEIINLLKKFNVNYKVQVANDNIKRLNINNYNLEKKLNNKSHKRHITLFSHANPNELYLILIRLYENFLSKLKFDGKLEIFIRLHPLCSRYQAISQIDKFRLKTSNYSFIFLFIENDKEAITDSMLSSEFCVFGESSYINIALKLGLKVIGIRTSFFYNPPIYVKYKTSKKGDLHALGICAFAEIAPQPIIASFSAFFLSHM